MVLSGLPFVDSAYKKLQFAQQKRLPFAQHQ